MESLPLFRLVEKFSPPARHSLLGYRCTDCKSLKATLTTMQPAWTMCIGIPTKLDFLVRVGLLHTSIALLLFSMNKQKKAYRNKVKSSWNVKWSSGDFTDHSTMWIGIGKMLRLVEFCALQIDCFYWVVILSMTETTEFNSVALSKSNELLLLSCHQSAWGVPIWLGSELALGSLMGKLFSITMMFLSDVSCEMNNVDWELVAKTGRAKWHESFPHTKTKLKLPTENYMMNEL